MELSVPPFIFLLASQGPGLQEARSSQLPRHHTPSVPQVLVTANLIWPMTVFSQKESHITMVILHLHTVCSVWAGLPYAQATKGQRKSAGCTRAVLGVPKARALYLAHHAASQIDAANLGDAREEL